MNWIYLSLAGYFFLAFSFVLDKLLLKKRIPEPAVYAFYVAILSLFMILIFPFGVTWINWTFFSIAIISGVIFIWGLLFYYKAVKINEISKVAPLVGTISQITALFLSVVFLGNVFYSQDFIGLLFLIIGGFMVSFDLPLKYNGILKGFRFSVLGGILMAIAFSLFEYLYTYLTIINESNVFLNGFVWTRMGLVVGGLSLLLFKKYRTNIFKSIFGKKKHHKKRRNWKTLAIFGLNKISGGSSSILINMAVASGGVALVYGIGSMQFVFVLLMVSIASVKYKDVFEEKLYFWDWAQKIGAIIMITIGMLLITF
jgi:uncharacterized membrane protein